MSIVTNRSLVMSAYTRIHTHTHTHTHTHAHTHTQTHTYTSVHPYIRVSFATHALYYVYSFSSSPHSPSHCLSPSLNFYLCLCLYISHIAGEHLRLQLSQYNLHSTFWLTDTHIYLHALYIIHPFTLYLYSSGSPSVTPKAIADLLKPIQAAALSGFYFFLCFFLYLFFPPIDWLIFLNLLLLFLGPTSSHLPFPFLFSFYISFIWLLFKLSISCSLRCPHSFPLF